MYAIVDIAGQQFKVEKDQKIFVHRLDAEEGSKVDFDQVLLVDDDGKVQVGMPVVKDFIVSASIISHVKGDKVKVFKKKRRKGYQKMNGHRQAFTQILIEGIGAGKAKTPVAKATGDKPKTAEKPKAEKTEVKKETAEKVTTTKSVTEKPATKKEPAKTTAKKEVKPAAKTTDKKETKPAAKKTAAPKAKKETAPKAKAAPKKKVE